MGDTFRVGIVRSGRSSLVAHLSLGIVIHVKSFTFGGELASPWDNHEKSSHNLYPSSTLGFQTWVSKDHQGERILRKIDRLKLPPFKLVCSLHSNPSHIFLSPGDQQTPIVRCLNVMLTFEPVGVGNAPVIGVCGLPACATMGT